MPNIQLDQLGSSELQERLKARFYALPDVEERQTTVSDPRARAMWLRDGVPIGDPDAFFLISVTSSFRRCFLNEAFAMVPAARKQP
jgi:hypothetical protein